MKTKILLIFSILFLTINAFCQFQTREADILFKKRIVRSLNLSCGINEELFGRGNLLVSVLLEAYKNGEIKGYTNSDLNKLLPLDQFMSSIQVNTESDSFIYEPRHMYKVELGEDLIFDNKHSEIVFDMEYLSVIIPAEINYKQIHEPIIYFSYDDCVKVFKNDDRAYAVNPLMNGRNINYSEVFLLRLFKSDIVKIGHDLYFDQMHSNPLSSFLAQKEAENKLNEYLYKLYHPQ
jgi:hypothetical protein